VREEAAGDWRKWHNELFTKYYEDDEIKEDEEVRECSMHRRDKKCI
jgi:hypothetical protein